MYFFSLFLTTAIVFLCVGCKKSIQEEPTTVVNEFTSIEELPSSSPSTSSNYHAMRMTVQLLSKQFVEGGQTINYRVILTKDNKPLTNYTFYVDDPVQEVCALIKTNSKGEAIFNSRTSKSQRPNFYSYRFFLDNAKVPPIIYTIVVFEKSKGIKLPGVKINISPSLEADFKTLRTSVYTTSLKNLGQTPEKSVEYIHSTFAKDVYNVVTSNLPNATVVSLAVISCLASAEVPTLAPYCVAFARVSASIIRDAVIKVSIINGIKASSLLNNDEKKKAIKDVETADLAITISQIKIGQGLKVVDLANNASAAWEISTALSTIDQPNGKFKGLYLTGVIKKGPNKGEVCVITCRKRN